MTTVFLDNKIISLGEGKSKSDSKNSAALIALKYLLSLDESCFDNALYIVSRSKNKNNSNSKQKTSNSKDAQNSDNKKELCSPFPKVDFMMEEVKMNGPPGNFLKKRKNSNENDSKVIENECPIRKKLQ